MARSNWTTPPFELFTAALIKKNKGEPTLFEQDCSGRVEHCFLVRPLLPKPCRCWGLMLHLITVKDYTHSARLLWTNNRHIAETSSWHTKNIRNREPCPRRDRTFCISDKYTKRYESTHTNRTKQDSCWSEASLADTNMTGALRWTLVLSSLLEAFHASLAPTEEHIIFPWHLDWDWLLFALTCSLVIAESGYSDSTRSEQSCSTRVGPHLNRHEECSAGKVPYPITSHLITNFIFR
jgi:hypothetical protein